MEIKTENVCNKCNREIQLRTRVFLKNNIVHYSGGKLCSGNVINKKWVAVEDEIEEVKDLYHSIMDFVEDSIRQKVKDAFDLHIKKLQGGGGK